MKKTLMVFFVVLLSFAVGCGGPEQESHQDITDESVYTEMPTEADSQTNISETETTSTKIPETEIYAELIPQFTFIAQEQILSTTDTMICFTVIGTTPGGYFCYGNSWNLCRVDTDGTYVFLGKTTEEFGFEVSAPDDETPPQGTVKLSFFDLTKDWDEPLKTLQPGLYCVEYTIDTNNAVAARIFFRVQ